MVKKLFIIVSSISFLMVLSSMLSSSSYSYTALSEARAILNSAPLNPEKSGYKEIDDKVAAIIKSFGAPDISTYDLVLGCYNYLIDNVYYLDDGGKIFLNNFDDKPLGTISPIPQYLVNYAVEPLYEGTGECTQYASAFTLMMRAIGLDAYTYTGRTRAAVGGYIPHAWTEICINGRWYIFDPQVEDNITKNNNIKYVYFCKTEDEMVLSYKWDDEATNRIKSLYGVDNKIKALPKDVKTAADMEQVRTLTDIFIADDEILLTKICLLKPIDKNMLCRMLDGYADRCTYSFTYANIDSILLEKVSILNNSDVFNHELNMQN